LTQPTALPLGSWLKTDPWDDKVHMLNAKRYAPMNARDKMPFEVTPIFYKLQRYDVAAAEPAAAPAGQAAPGQAAPPAPADQQQQAPPPPATGDQQQTAPPAAPPADNNAPAPQQPAAAAQNPQ
jgi:hypothetical protein